MAAGTVSNLSNPVKGERGGGWIEGWMVFLSFLLSFILSLLFFTRLDV